MKKVLLLLAVAGVVAFSSCNKKKTCCYELLGAEVCEEDQDKDQQKAWEAAGGECK